jgi:hypothetical protein
MASICNHCSLGKHNVGLSMEFWKVWSVEEQSCLQPDGLTILKKSSSYVKIQGARSVIWSMFHTEDPQMLLATVQNVVTQETWRPRFVHVCLYQWYEFGTHSVLYSQSWAWCSHILALNAPYTMCRLHRMFSHFVYDTKVTLARHFCTRRILRTPLCLHHISVFPSHKTRRIQDTFLRLLCLPNMYAGYNLDFKFTVWCLCRS